MTPEEQLRALRIEAAAFHSAVGDLDAPVPACAPWRVRDLVRHLGSVHRMFRRVADEGWMQRPPRLEIDDRPSVEDDAVAGWARHETAALIAALERLDPSEPRWNFTDGPQVGAFIPRRMLHETTVHRWDLQAAYTRPDPIPRDVAIDGVREFLEVQLPRSGDWPGPHARVRVFAHDQYLTDLELSPGSRVFPRSESTHDARPDLLIRGDAERLLLAWWGRTSLLEVAEGAAELVRTVDSFARR